MGIGDYAQRTEYTTSASSFPMAGRSQLSARENRFRRQPVERRVLLRREPHAFRPASSSGMVKRTKVLKTLFVGWSMMG